MIWPNRRRPPTPVVVAIALYVVRFVIAPVVQELWSALRQSLQTDSTSWNVRWLIVDVVVTGLYAALAYGLLRGSNGARVLALVLVAVGLVLGTGQISRFPSWWLLSWAAQMAITATAGVLLYVPAAHTWFSSDRTPWGSAPRPGPPEEPSPDLEALWKETEGGERR